MTNDPTIATPTHCETCGRRLLAVGYAHECGAGDVGEKVRGLEATVETLLRRVRFLESQARVGR